MPAENLWRVDIVNAVSDEADENGKKAIWHSINSQVYTYSIIFSLQQVILLNYQFSENNRKAFFSISGAINPRQ